MQVFRPKGKIIYIIARKTGKCERELLSKFDKKVYYYSIGMTTTRRGLGLRGTNKKVKDVH